MNTFSTPLTDGGCARALLFCALLTTFASGAVEAQQAILRYDSIHHPVKGQHGMVVSQRQVASEVGAQILAKGGNAVDAAVATAFALAVVLPRAGNLAGGGFMIVHKADTEETISLDFRERAPRAASRDMFLNEQGEVSQELYRYSHLAVATPGTVAGLETAWRKYGELPWKDLVQPAIDLARDGFTVSYDLSSALAARASRLQRSAYTASLYYDSAGNAPQPGTTLTFPELADTLTLIRDNGRAGFYAGPVADLFVAEMARGGGLITHADLADYQVRERPPVRGAYMDAQIFSMPPPSSGGVHLVQMLNVLSHFPLRDYGQGSAATLHILAETMKYAYADRSKHLGDPDFASVPQQWLTSADYAREIAGRIQAGRATPADRVRPGQAPTYESEDTTHLSTMDVHGNAVSLTTTLNFSFGNGIAVPGAGFLLNNEMTDFSAKPGVPDGFGLLTSDANAVEPFKRPLSAMTPTMVIKNGRVILVTGSPGGSRIINAVLQNVVNVLAFGMNVAAANHQPRIHHQWMPDVLRLETGVGHDTQTLLRDWGHPIELSETMGSVQSIAYDGEVFFGAADPRRPGAAAIAPSASSEKP